MAAKSKKRLSKIDNKLLKLEKLQLKDVICSICQSILIEPVTLPCYHDFCLNCFNGSVENNALCCPLCRLRIGSWLRTATKQRSLTNTKLWEFIKSKFSKELNIKLQGEDLNLSDDSPTVPRLSKPGEIREEYEAEVNRYKQETRQLEQKHFHETEQLVRKLQNEEEEAHNKYLERIKEDELLAKKLQGNNLQTNSSANADKSIKNNRNKKKIKTTKLDSYVMRKTAIAKLRDSTLLTDDNTSTDSTTSRNGSTPNQATKPSPELVPSYSKYLKSFLEKKNSNATHLWNKENGGSVSQKETSHKEGVAQVKEVKFSNTPKKCAQSVPVSLPYKGKLHLKRKLTNVRKIETSSVDSMRQELCYFKPIEVTTPTRFKKTHVGLPLKVPGVKSNLTSSPIQSGSAPSRTQYIDSLCQLRNGSLSKNLPSAFVIALKLLRVNTEHSSEHGGRLKIKLRKNVSLSSNNNSSLLLKSEDDPLKQYDDVDGIAKLENQIILRRTRSMGSIPKTINETTPKKAKVKERKVYSERKKPYLRSSKKPKVQKLLSSPSMTSEPIINKNTLVRDLSNPLKSSDVEILLEEQLRIEKLIEQEKNDLELAKKMDAELNGRQLRRSAVKRQMTLNYSLGRPEKKLKV